MNEQERADKLSESIDRLMAGQQIEASVGNLNDPLLDIARQLAYAQYKPSRAAQIRFNRQVDQWFAKPERRPFWFFPLATTLATAAAVIVLIFVFNSGVLNRVSAPQNTEIPAATASVTITSTSSPTPTMTATQTLTATTTNTSTPTNTVTPSATLTATLPSTATRRPVTRLPATIAATPVPIIPTVDDHGGSSGSGSNSSGSNNSGSSGSGGSDSSGSSGSGSSGGSGDSGGGSSGGSDTSGHG